MTTSQAVNKYSPCHSSNSLLGEQDRYSPQSMKDYLILCLNAYFWKLLISECWVFCTEYIRMCFVRVLESKTHSCRGLYLESLVPGPSVALCLSFHRRKKCKQCHLCLTGQIGHIILLFISWVSCQQMCCRAEPLNLW